LAVLASGFFSLLFHATEQGSYDIMPGVSVDHMIPPSATVNGILSDDLLSFLTAQTKLLLKLDEVAAVLLVALLLKAIFDAAKPNLSPAHRVLGALSFPFLRFPLSTFSALACLIASDFFLAGAPHVILHSLWHMQAFALFERIMTKLDKVVEIHSPQHSPARHSSLSRPRHGSYDEFKLS
jgi:hypothetical protein